MTAAPILAEHTWLRRRTDACGARASRGRDSARRWTPTDRAHDPRPPVPHPSRVPQRLEAAVSAWSIPRSVRRATVVTVPTEYVRRTVIDAYGISPDRVMVVPHGVEPTLGADAPSASRLRLDYAPRRRTRARLPCDHTSSQGAPVPARGDGPALGRPRSPLRAARRPGSVDAQVAATIDRLGLGRRVVRPGRVRDADRDGLIALADRVGVSRASTRDSVLRSSRRWRSAHR